MYDWTLTINFLSVLFSYFGAGLITFAFYAIIGLYHGKFLQRNLDQLNLLYKRNLLNLKDHVSHKSVSKDFKDTLEACCINTLSDELILEKTKIKHSLEQEIKDASKKLDDHKRERPLSLLNLFSFMFLWPIYYLAQLVNLIEGAMRITEDYVFHYPLDFLAKKHSTFYINLKMKKIKEYSSIS